MKRIGNACMVIISGAALLAFSGGCATSPEPAASIEALQIKNRDSRRYLKPYKVLGKWYRPLADATGYQQTGIASWYGDAFHGRPTSSGEIYNMHGISAAHKTLPLGTVVRVKNLENGRTLDVQVNDRGPFVAGRIIDLSRGAAHKLDVFRPGTARVEVTAIGSAPLKRRKAFKKKKIKQPDYQNGNFVVQIGVFGERENAMKLVNALNKTYKNAYIKADRRSRNNRSFYRVLVGEYSNLRKAETFEQALRAEGYHDAFTIAE